MLSINDKEKYRYKDKFVGSNYSRYENREAITYSDNVSNLETQPQLRIPRDVGDRYFVVTSPYENRLDLVSYKFYGVTLYWWAIAYASGITNPLQVPVGTSLRIPSVNTIQNIRGESL